MPYIPGESIAFCLFDHFLHQCGVPVCKSKTLRLVQVISRVCTGYSLLNRRKLAQKAIIPVSVQDELSDTQHRSFSLTRLIIPQDLHIDGLLTDAPERIAHAGIIEVALKIDKEPVFPGSSRNRS